MKHLLVVYPLLCFSQPVTMIQLIHFHDITATLMLPLGI